ncbi:MULTISPECIES: GNAT family N-acetyltransferase [Gammaproteobacteria]|uniref:GNAT family N-acetyltransferase n=1 Tax=Gammaproteobacteria TaxID=1236 RepID=UPI000DCFA524|nr:MULTISPECIES: GNAT family N-acetyltransferase [Gammaproteobacteria]RTE86949.1 GNAT family N-acetyltransferase [Aliidiomarina sp. B3213]TCZ93261.1 GNAT family N-acetyltransferase [Lysobacter sp. N42]
MDIRVATHEDVDHIHALAEQWLLSNQEAPERTGFLISNFSKETYHQYVDSAEYFWIAETDGTIDAFLLAYSRDSIKPEEVINSCLRFSVIEDFVLIKQICANRDSKVRGAAFKLYNKLFKEMRQDYALAAVVNEPLNTKSIEFHQRAGFKHLWDLTPPPDFDGEIRTRSIWCFSKKGSLPETRMARGKGSEALTQLVEKSQTAADLYMHEDNLNWTKLGMLVTFMTALLTAFAILIERDMESTDPWMVSILIIFGLVINLMFYNKIKSGLAYLDFHKANVRAFDQSQCNLDPHMPRILHHGAEKTSATAKLLQFVPILSLGLWSVCSIMLFARFIVPNL